MNKIINGAASNAMVLASDAASWLRDGAVSWVPGAIKAIGAGTSLVVLRDGSRKVVGAARRNPVATAAAMTVAVGTGVALWVLKRSKQRHAAGAANAPIEVEPVRVGRKPARRTARKTSSRKAATKTTATSTKPAAST